MYGIDGIDKKILTELDRRSRTNLKTIAKRIKTPYHVVSYRFDRMVKEGIIKKFVTEFGLGKLGYFVYKIFFQLRGMSGEKQGEFLSYLVGNREVIWVAVCEGRWDLMIAVYAGNVVEFAKVKDEIFGRYGNLISEYDTTIIKENYLLKRGYLLHPGEPRTFPRKHRQELYIGGTEKAWLDEGDKKILREMPDGARMSLMELAEKAGLNAKTVSSKVKEMEKNGVIQGYTVLLDLNRIGYKFYKMVIYLQDMRMEKYRKFIEFCKRQQNVIHLIEAVGPWEIELEIETTSDAEYYALSKAIRNRFPDTVKKIETAFISEEMKLVYLPAGL